MTIRDGLPKALFQIHPTRACLSAPEFRIGVGVPDTQSGMKGRQLEPGGDALQRCSERWIGIRRPWRGDVVEFDRVAVRQGGEGEYAVGWVLAPAVAAGGAAATHCLLSRYLKWSWPTEGNFLSKLHELISGISQNEQKHVDERYSVLNDV
jgi:hypothetical protein